MSEIDIHEIKTLLPHRYPFLLVDKVTEISLNESITAIKNVTVNEPFFNGHFPERAVMPGVLMIEALAQAGGILIMKSLQAEGINNALFLLAGVDKARFRRMVSPGDQLVMKVSVVISRKELWKFKAEGFVDDQLAVNTEFTVLRAPADD